jgi:hypothetical protein
MYGKPTIVVGLFVWLYNWMEFEMSILLLILLIWFCVVIGDSLIYITNEESIFDDVSEFNYFDNMWRNDILPTFGEYFYLRIFYPIIKLIQFCFFILLGFFFPIWYPTISYVRFVMGKKV